MLTSYSSLKSSYDHNHLKHYHTTIQKCQHYFSTISTYADFSENSKIPVKSKNQSLHWSHKQITLHSGILKVNGAKSHHKYISDNLKHDQHFVYIVLDVLAEEPGITVNKYVIIETNNCASQYKSAGYFFIQKKCRSIYAKYCMGMQHCQAWKRLSGTCWQNHEQQSDKMLRKVVFSKRQMML